MQTPQRPVSQHVSAALDDEQTPRPIKREISQAARAYISLARDSNEDEDTPRPAKRPFGEGETVNDQTVASPAKQSKGNGKVTIEIEDEDEDSMMYEG
jgi:hypothetical protein